MKNRTSVILMLLLLCATLTTWFFSAVELRNLEEELSRLEAERNQLRIQYFRELEEREHIYREMREWLDEWDVREAEITGYAPLDARAIPGMCYSGDPRVTSSGAKTTLGITAAAPVDVPFGTRVYIPSRGEMRVVQDRGGRVGYTEDGVMQLDLCVETREEALDTIERQKVVAVVKK